MVNFCPSCGQRVEDSWSVCPNCGQKLGSLRGAPAQGTQYPGSPQSSQPPTPMYGPTGVEGAPIRTSNVFGIISLIISLIGCGVIFYISMLFGVIISVVALILGILGIKKDMNRKIAIAGIVLAAIGLTIGLVTMIIIFGLMFLYY